MPRVNKVEKAAKARPEYGIAVGDTYYWWKRRKGPKQYSKTYPKRSQLTGSNFLATIYDIEDDIARAAADADLPSARDDFAQRLRDLAEETQSSLDNMPEGLQQGDTGQMMQTRIEGLETAADEMEEIDMDDPPEDLGPDADDAARDERDEEIEEYWQEKLGELQGVEIQYE